MENAQKKSAQSNHDCPCHSSQPYLNLLAKTYRKNELIVTFKKNPSAKDIETVKGYFAEMGITGIKIKKCDGCELPVQLWIADDIETVVVAKGVKAGSGGNTGTVGESYSLNFLSKIPPHNWDKGSYGLPSQKSYNIAVKQEVVTIAVLDTGVDPFIVEPGYMANDLQNKPGYPCFSDSTHGWNFVANNGDIEDDNPGRHGSLVSQFIINEFKKTPEKTVQIIPLKTHNQDGEGSLFNIFCAIYYAIAKGAKIINASWGFYFYEGDTVLTQLNILLKTLKEQGILFVTAAGNQTDIDDMIESIIYYGRNNVFPTQAQLRNLAVHPFYPACLSPIRNNLITVTTTDTEKVAATENYSNVFVDLGVINDKSDDENLGFNVPFKFSKGQVRGSSFATAIATGIIGANCSKGLYARHTINKNSFIDELFGISQRGGSHLCTKHATLNVELIKNGVCLQK
jgi:hypothetical protein